MRYSLVQDNNCDSYTESLVQQLIGLFGQQAVGQIAKQPASQLHENQIWQQPVAKMPQMPKDYNIALKSSLPSIKEIEKELGSKK